MRRITRKDMLLPHPGRPQHLKEQHQPGKKVVTPNRKRFSHRHHQLAQGLPQASYSDFAQTSHFLSKHTLDESVPTVWTETAHAPGRTQCPQKPVDMGCLLLLLLEKVGGPPTRTAPGITPVPQTPGTDSGTSCSMVKLHFHHVDGY